MPTMEHMHLQLQFVTRLKILGISMNKRKRKSYCAMQTTCKKFSSTSLTSIQILTRILSYFNMIFNARMTMKTSSHVLPLILFIIIMFTNLVKGQMSCIGNVRNHDYIYGMEVSITFNILQSNYIQSIFPNFQHFNYVHLHDLKQGGQIIGQRMCFLVIVSHNQISAQTRNNYINPISPSFEVSQTPLANSPICGTAAIKKF